MNEESGDHLRAPGVIAAQSVIGGMAEEVNRGTAL